MQGSRLIGEQNFKYQLRSKSACSPVFWVLSFVCSKNTKRATRRSIRSARHYAQLTIATSKIYYFFSSFSPHTEKSRGRGNKIVLGTVVKAQIGEEEEEVRAGFPIRISKELTGVYKWELKLF